LSESERLEELANQLDSVAESLSDCAMDVLRAAISQATTASGEQARRREKVINRARTSVEKAARLARQAARASDDEEEEAGGEPDF
jgi:hypothetical protein